MELKDLLENPEELGDLADYGAEAQAKLLEIINSAHRNGKFRCVFDDQNRQHTKDEILIAYALAAAGKQYEFQADGGYFIGASGPGWFTIGVGCPFASAGTALFIQEL